jgi:hypothetical protein
MGGAGLTMGPTRQVTPRAAWEPACRAPGARARAWLVARSRALLPHDWAAHTPRTRVCTAPGWAVLGEAGPSCFSFLVYIYFSNCVQTLKFCNLS